MKLNYEKIARGLGIDEQDSQEGKLNYEKIARGLNASIDMQIKVTHGFGGHIRLTKLETGVSN